jgi:hypothetical protein
MRFGAIAGWCTFLCLGSSACGGSNEPCRDCAEDAARADSGSHAQADAHTSDAATREAGAPDASLAEAGVVEDGGSSDGASAAPDAEAANDAGPEPDAEPPECRTAADCTLPQGLLGCERCQDGSMACPQVGCVDGFCATWMATPCAERRPTETCQRDEDCARPECKLLCQGDGRSACLPSRCSGGLCQPTYGACGLSLEPCPEGTRAGRECGECWPSGGCSFHVLGCFDGCDAATRCPGEQQCVEGLCQFTHCP